MRVIKRLHVFILQSFLPLFAMTFFIVLFIVLMQFLWKFIDDLVGKGLSLDLLAELFFYASVSMVPMALPLAILLASLMTFGNLGERFELTALKASGISLIRVMAPLIVLVGGIAVGAFFFQNDVLPKAQVKMWTLLFSIKQKAPELEIPEGVFYDQIPNFNLYVGHKDQETGMLYDVMIYDVSRGGDNSTIILSDSARMAFTRDSRYLYLHLYEGEQFENLRDQRTTDHNIPFRRESFFDKELLVPFDANFNRMDDDAMRRQYVGKNIAELRHSIDSIGAMVDSAGQLYGRMLRTERLGGVAGQTTLSGDSVLPYVAVTMPKEAIHLDSLMQRLPPSRRQTVYDDALQSVSQRRASYEFRALAMGDEKRSVRRHEIELLKKFTLSVACLIFFFIGAPLGAIIRKGGLGTPLVVSILFFVIYYVIDNTGYKMARDGHWNVPFGIWLSTFVLAPLGVYITYKAMNDSAVFDKDAYINFFRRLIGAKETRKVEMKEVIINDISVPDAIERMRSLQAEARAFLASQPKRMSYWRFWMQGYDTNALRDLSERLDKDIVYLTDCRDKMVVVKLLDFPTLRSLWVYHAGTRRWLAWAMLILFPLGIPVWLIGMRSMAGLRHDVERIIEVSGEERRLLGDTEADEPQIPPEAEGSEHTAEDAEDAEISEAPQSVGDTANEPKSDPE